MGCISAQYTDDQFGFRTFKVFGAAGDVHARAARLASGHPFVEVSMTRRDGRSDVLTIRRTEPFREAWDRGGDATLLAMLETQYEDLLDSVR